MSDTDSDSISLTSTIEETWDDDDVFQVETILAETGPEEDRKYLVKWENYEWWHNSFEPVESFVEKHAIKAWEITKLKQQKGVERPFNVSRWQAKVDQRKKASELRKARREAKREKRGLTRPKRSSGDEALAIDNDDPEDSDYEEQASAPSRSNSPESSESEANDGTPEHLDTSINAPSKPKPSSEQHLELDKNDDSSDDAPLSRKRRRNVQGSNTKAVVRDTATSTSTASAHTLHGKNKHPRDESSRIHATPGHASKRSIPAKLPGSTTLGKYNVQARVTSSMRPPGQPISGATSAQPVPCKESSMNSRVGPLPVSMDRGSKLTGAQRQALSRSKTALAERAQVPGQSTRSLSNVSNAQRKSAPSMLPPPIGISSGPPRDKAKPAGPGKQQKFPKNLQHRYNNQKKHLEERTPDVSQLRLFDPSAGPAPRPAPKHGQGAAGSTDDGAAAGPGDGGMAIDTIAPGQTVTPRPNQQVATQTSSMPHQKESGQRVLNVPNKQPLVPKGGKSTGRPSASRSSEIRQGHGGISALLTSIESQTGPTVRDVQTQVSRSTPTPTEPNEKVVSLSGFEKLDALEPVVFEIPPPQIAKGHAVLLLDSCFVEEPEGTGTILKWFIAAMKNSTTCMWRLVVRPHIHEWLKQVAFELGESTDSADQAQSRLWFCNLLLVEQLVPSDRLSATYDYQIADWREDPVIVSLPKETCPGLKWEHPLSGQRRALQTTQDNDRNLYMWFGVWSKAAAVNFRNFLPISGFNGGIYQDCEDKWSSSGQCNPLWSMEEFSQKVMSVHRFD